MAQKAVSNSKHTPRISPTPALADVVEATDPFQEGPLGAASATRVLARGAKSHPGREIYRPNGKPYPYPYP